MKPLIAGFLILGLGQSRSSAEHPAPETINYGVKNVEHTAAFWAKYGKPEKWSTRNIDWKDKSYESRWLYISKDFENRRYDFHKYREYVERYRKSRSYAHLLDLCMAFLLLGSPNDRDLLTYSDATFDPEFGTTLYALYRDSFPNEPSALEMRVMLRLDMRMCRNPDAWLRLYRIFASKRLADDTLTRSVAVSVFTNYLTFGSDGKDVPEFAAKVKSIAGSSQDMRNRACLAGSYIAMGKLKKDVKLFDQGWELHRRNNIELGKSTCIYDRAVASRFDAVWKQREKNRRKWFP